MLIDWLVFHFHIFARRLRWSWGRIYRLWSNGRFSWHIALTISKWCLLYLVSSTSNAQRHSSSLWMFIKDVYWRYSSSRSQVLTVIYPIIILQFQKFFQVWYAWFSWVRVTITVTLLRAIMCTTNFIRYSVYHCKASIFLILMNPTFLFLKFSNL